MEKSGVLFKGEDKVGLGLGMWLQLERYGFCVFTVLNIQYYFCSSVGALKNT